MMRSVTCSAARNSSAAAARSNAEEDFVETYKYKVLADAAPKLTIELRLRGRDINTLGLLDSGAVAKKVSCLRDLGLLSAVSSSQKPGMTGLRVQTKR